MSGGSYDYAYAKVDEFANEVALTENLARPGCRSGLIRPDLRLRFIDHLRKVALAMRAIEWNDSGDGDDQEIKLIKECLK